MHAARFEIDLVDGVYQVLNAAVELPAARAHDVLGVREPEGNEEQPGLVHVAVVLVDNDDLGLIRHECPTKSVSDKRPSGSGSQHDDAMHAFSRFVESMLCTGQNRQAGTKVPIRHKSALF
jgi:hypothetical protein